MKVKVFYPDKNGRISFTKEELQKLLDEVYKEGYDDARPYYWSSPYWTWTNNPSITTTPYYTTCSNGDSTANSTTNYLNTSVPIDGQSGQVLAVGGDIPEPHSYQIKFETVET